jgi:hypothetical protein
MPLFKENTCRKCLLLFRNADSASVKTRQPLTTRGLRSPVLDYPVLNVQYNVLLSWCVNAERMTGNLQRFWARYRSRFLCIAWHSSVESEWCWGYVKQPMITGGSASHGTKLKNWHELWAVVPRKESSSLVWRWRTVSLSVSFCSVGILESFCAESFVSRFTIQKCKN